MNHASVQDSQPPITPTATPAQPSAPFDPDTLPPQLRAELDHFSDIGIDALALIYARRAAEAATAATAATIAEAAHTNEAAVRREAEAAHVSDKDRRSP